MFKSIFQKMIDGFIYGFGFVFFSSIIVSVGLVATDQISVHQVKQVLRSKGVLPQEAAVKESETQTTVLKDFYAPRIPIPEGYQQLFVDNSKAFLAAIKTAHKAKGKFVITLASGEYKIVKQLHIKVDNIMIRSETGNPYDVTIRGPGMFYTGRDVGNIFRVTGDHFYLDGITLTDVKNHLIQIAGESGASYPKINNCILQDGYEQFIKVSYSKNTPKNQSIGGIISNSIFQYTRDIAPNYYTGGIDAIGAVDWIVENNIFRDIASPSQYIAQHAVHFWVNASNTIVRNNLFIDVDRAIGFGMPLKHNNRVLTHSHLGGSISGNVIYHSDNGDPYADTGIILESAQGAMVENNYIFMEHDYPRAIEYRFGNIENVTIQNNHVNKSISSRDGASAKLKDNNDELQKLEFIEQLNRIQNELSVIELYKPIANAISN